MDVLEQANKYAEGKANEAITKAIADAYIEGYNAGYKNCEKKFHRFLLSVKPSMST